MDITLVDPSVLVAAITSAEGIGVVVLGAIFAHFEKKSERRAEQSRKEDLEYRADRERREEARKKRDAALYGVVLSTARGSEVLLQKARGDELNGEVSHALNSIENSISKFNNVSNEELSNLG